MIEKKVIPQALFLATAIFVSSCGLRSERTNPSSSENNQQQPQEPENISTTLKLSLDDFKGIPDEVDGCACYFSETEQKFKNNEYVFAAGFDSIGFVAVDNKLVKLKLISTGREPNTLGDNNHIDIYSSELYKVIVDIRYKRSNGDEAWWNEGTVTIESKDGQKVTKKFVGECGC